MSDAEVCLIILSIECVLNHNGDSGNWKSQRKESEEILWLSLESDSQSLLLSVQLKSGTLKVKHRAALVGHCCSTSIFRLSSRTALMFFHCTSSLKNNYLYTWLHLLLIVMTFPDYHRTGLKLAVDSSNIDMYWNDMRMIAL